jgi:hypothetical protein|nr:MAG TPA: hypothetical protein [Caudoviricetes sp.]
MLNNDEKLALLEAMSKKIKPELESLKGEAKLGLMDAFAESGVDRRAILVDGQKVGEIGITYSTAKPYIKPGHEAEALEYLTSLGLTETVPVKGWEKHFTHAGDAVLHAESGEIADCLEWEPSVAKTAAVRGCKPDEVLEAIQPKLRGESPAALLGW